MTLTRVSDPKIMLFRSTYDGYQDKRPLSIFKVNGRQVTDLHFLALWPLLGQVLP